MTTVKRNAYIDRCYKVYHNHSKPDVVQFSKLGLIHADIEQYLGRYDHVAIDLRNSNRRLIRSEGDLEPPGDLISNGKSRENSLHVGNSPENEIFVENIKS